MDKSDSRLHCEQIEKLMKAGRYNEAVYLADKVDWRKEDDIKRLIQTAEAYRRTRRYDDAVNILKMAHNRKPNNKKIVYLLCETYFEMKDVVTAQVYLDRYQSMTDRTDWHYDALKYKRSLAYELPVTEKIDILEELKRKEPAAEQFRFELAKLYNQARQYAECAAECDELVLLFGDDGKYARKALELKKSCVPLTDEQESLLRKLSLGTIDKDHASSGDVKMMNTMDMSALNLESSLAKDIQTLKSEETEPSQRRKRKEFHTRSLEQTVPPSTQEIFFSDKTEDISFTKYDLPISKAADIKEVKAPVSKKSREAEMEEHLYSESDGQMAFSDASFADDDDEQITGQITVDDLLSDWSKIKERNTRNLRQSIHEDVVEQTGKIFEKKKEEVEEESEEVPGSIWKEVEELSDEFDEKTIEELISETKEEYSEEVTEAEENEDEPVTEAESETVTEVEEAEEAEETEEVEAEEEIPEEEEEKALEETEADSETEEEITEEESAQEAEEVEEESVKEAKEVPYVLETTAADMQETKVIPDDDEIEALLAADEEEKNKTEEEQAEEETESEESEDSYDEEGDANDVDESAEIKDLSPEERKLFSQFLHPRSMRIQIANALENISLAAYVGNVIITSDNNETGFALAKSIVKFVKFADGNFSGAMSKINALELNNKDISKVFDKLNNGALVIEDANKLSNNALIRITQEINQEERGILMFLIDTKAEIKKLLMRQRTLTNYFNIRIDIIAMSEAALVDYGMKYANNLGYSIDEGFANMAFHKRVREAQAGNHSVTIAEVKAIVDEAIERCDRSGVSNLFRKVSKKYRDENGMIELREKDFN